MNKKTGLAFIELVLIIAVICGLIIYAVMRYAEKEAWNRDILRGADIKQLQHLLAVYAEKNGSFPICSRLVVDGFGDCLSVALQSLLDIKSIPVDPLGKGTGECDSDKGRVYCYASLGDGTGYVLEYFLETDKIDGGKKGARAVKVGF